MDMFSQQCDLDKNGLIKIAELGDYEVVANRERYERDRVNKFAVASDEQDVVASVHETPHEAVFQARELREE